MIRRGGHPTPGDGLGPDGTVRLRCYLPHADTTWLSLGCGGAHGCHRIVHLGIAEAIRLMIARRGFCVPICGSQITVDFLPLYIPLFASLEYISCASFLESGASPIRSKIRSGSSPRLYARTTWVCRRVFGVNSFAIPVRFCKLSKSILIRRSE